MVLRAILSPPDAEPVIPAITFTKTASEIRGFSGDKPNKNSLTMINPVKVAITDPYPTSDAVLKIGSNDPSAPSLSDSFRSFQRFQLSRIIAPQDTTKAITIAQIPRTLDRGTAPNSSVAR